MTTELAQDDEFLPELRQGVRVTGLAPSGSVEVVTVERYGAAAANVVYRTFDGRMDERVVLAGQESDLRVIVDEPAARFDGDGELFRLGMEARRIAMAARFDPMLAVTTSDLEPLPHQIKAVYGGPPRAAATARPDAARRQLTKAATGQRQQRHGSCGGPTGRTWVLTPPQLRPQAEPITPRLTGLTAPGHLTGA
jgi:hypothetical protein